MDTLSERINNYANGNNVRLHVPAHAGTINLKDLTELDGLDTLHSPNGVLLQAEKLCAKLFNTESSFFSVAGASLANQVACLALKSYLVQNSINKPILVARNVHRSVVAGIILAGFEVVWLDPAWDEKLGVYTRIELDENIINTQFGAVIITNPSYEGFYSIIPKLSVPLIVDEAHGAHYYFSELLPQGALDYGADLVIHSFHKSLGSLTQTGAIHVNRGSLINSKLVSAWMHLLQTTSPSYLLLESLEHCIFEYSNRGQDLIAKAISNAALINEEFRYMKNDDPTRLLLQIQSEQGSVSGSSLETELQKNKIYVEANYQEHLLALSNPYNKFSDLKKLNETLKMLQACKNLCYSQSITIPKPKADITINREGFLRNAEEIAAPCPPGIIKVPEVV